MLSNKEEQRIKIQQFLSKAAPYYDVNQLGEIHVYNEVKDFLTALRENREVIKSNDAALIGNKIVYYKGEFYEFSQYELEQDKEAQKQLDKDQTEKLNRLTEELQELQEKYTQIEYDVNRKKSIIVKGTVHTYQDLARVENPKVNECYRIETGTYANSYFIFNGQKFERLSGNTDTFETLDAYFSKPENKLKLKGDTGEKGERGIPGQKGEDAPLAQFVLDEKTGEFKYKYEGENEYSYRTLGILKGSKGEKGTDALEQYKGFASEFSIEVDERNEPVYRYVHEHRVDDTQTIKKECVAKENDYIYNKEDGLFYIARCGEWQQFCIRGKAGKNGLTPFISYDNQQGTLTIKLGAQTLVNNVRIKGEDGQRGERGETGKKGEPGKSARNIILDFDEVTKTIKWKYEDEDDIKLRDLYTVKDGVDGKNGLNGKDARNLVLDFDEATKTIKWKYEDEDNEQLRDLYTVKDGIDGTNGIDGKDGLNALDQYKGTASSMTAEEEAGKFTYFYTDDSNEVVEAVENDYIYNTDKEEFYIAKKGKWQVFNIKGVKGLDGLTPEITYDKVNGTLAVKLGDKIIVDNVKIKGDKGDKGEDGQRGMPGRNGSDGKDGKDGKTPIIDLDNKTGDLKWKYANDLSSSWTSLGIVKGSDGKDGLNGKDALAQYKGNAINLSVEPDKENEPIYSYEKAELNDSGEITYKKCIAELNDYVYDSDRHQFYIAKDDSWQLFCIKGEKGADAISPNVIYDEETGRLTIIQNKKAIVNNIRIKGEKGDQGIRGIRGVTGQNGKNGLTPIFNYASETGNLEILYEDNSNPKPQNINIKGPKGDPGVSPELTVSFNRENNILTVRVIRKDIKECGCDHEAGEPCNCEILDQVDINIADVLKPSFDEIKQKYAELEAKHDELVSRYENAVTAIEDLQLAMTNVQDRLLEEDVNNTALSERIYTNDDHLTWNKRK